MPQILGWITFLNPDGYGGPFRVYVSNDGGSYVSTFLTLCYLNGTAGSMMHTRN